MKINKILIPTCKAEKMFARACPYVSWQCTASLDTGTSLDTVSISCLIPPGVPIPIVSPSEIS